ncbi:hypothetical protein PT974_10105 [Cladobotryum mycophilum]|uniref:Uncharacterized protein n=1 Tax=Cladobotryum mycophilum TaxID=491253 RepID=A0ABR0S8X9_9HYPO
MSSSTADQGGKTPNEGKDDKPQPSDKAAQDKNAQDKGGQGSSSSGSGGGFYNPKPSDKDQDQSGGRFYKFRCENWNADPVYCESWLYVNHAYCAMCMAKGLDKSRG